MIELEQKIIELVRPYTTCKSTITLESKFKDDLKLDSLSLIEFIVDCEDEFEIEIDLDDPAAKDIKILKDLVETVNWLKTR